MKLSIVTTLYQSSSYVEDFYHRIVDVAEKLVDSFELIFVDDGSPDNSVELAINLSNKDPRVRVIELSKNFGHHRAMMVGLEHVTGERVFLIDCDLEEPPESLIDFWATFEEEADVDMVYGINNVPKEGGVFKRFASSLFYRIFNFFSFVAIPANELVSRLMTDSYVKALVSYPERDLFIPGIWADVGFKSNTLIVNKTFDGFSSYSLKKRLTMAVDAVTAFSTKPLVFIFYLGLIIFTFSLTTIVFLLFKKLFLGAVLSGWTSLLVSMYFIGGATILSIGVIGIYLSRIFTEVKQRPKYIVRKLHNFKNTNKF